MKFKYILSIFIVLALSVKLASAYYFTITGYVYYGSSSFTVPNHKIYFSSDGAAINDSAFSDYYGYYSITFDLPKDSTYLFNVYTNDDCEDDSSNFLHHIYSASGTFYVYVETCMLSNYCQAYYNYNQLSEKTIRFFDTSIGDVTEWFWNFGDGEYSYEQNPTHTYSGYGFYEVALTIFTTDSCTSSWYYYIYIVEQAYIDGIVKAGPNMLPKGRVFIFEIDYFYDNIIPTYNTSFPIDSGIFKIPYDYDIPYMLFVVPELNVPDYYFPEYFPTYSGDEKYWEDCSFFMPELNDTFKIDLVRRDSIFYGHGTINGFINTEQMWNSNMENSNILLLDADYNPLKYSFFNYDNTYSLNQLPYGNYYLLINKINIPSYPVFVSISENNPIAEINFTTDKGEIITSIPDKEKINNKQNIFPNPFTDEITIHFNNISKPQTPIIVYNYSGQIVYSEIVSVLNNKVQINLANLCNGIYFIKTTSNTFKVQKTGY